MRILIIGLGQLGASVAMAAARCYPNAIITGVDIAPNIIKSAINQQIIAKGYTGKISTNDSFDLCVICTPTSYIADIVRVISGQKLAAIITDVGSIKNPIIRSLSDIDASAAYVPAHPLAGKEKSGLDNADAALFLGKKVIVTPCHTHNDEQKQFVIKFWENLGSKVNEMNAAEHDIVYAVVSHAIQFLAYCYAELVMQSNTTPPDSNDFKKFFRLYASDANMWADIFIANYINIEPVISDILNLMNEQKVALFGELPRHLAGAVKQYTQTFSETNNVDVESFAAGAYPDFILPDVSADFNPAFNKELDDMDINIKISDFKTIASKFMSSAKVGSKEYFVGRVQYMQKIISAK